MTADAKPLLAVDLDGTATTTNTFPHFLRFLLADRIRQGDGRAALGLAFALLGRKVLRLRHERLKTVVCKYADRVAYEAVAAWSADLFGRYASAEVLRTVSEWDGQVVLTTAAPERYAEHFGKLLGVDEVHGSRLVDGLLDHNVGGRKVERLEHEGFGAPACAISDDEEVDAPLLKAAQKALVVRDAALEEVEELRKARRRVHFVASLGGHLELLIWLRGVGEGHDRTWVTSGGARADDLRRQNERVTLLPRLDRGSVSLRRIVAGVRLAFAERPELIVTSGAGLTVPFTLTSRLLGARILFVETMARVSTGSLSGRICAPVADRVFIQWPDLRASYPDAVLCRPALLEAVEPPDRRPGVGTFVTVGSHDVPFTRLLVAVQQAVERGLLPEPVMAQVGVASTSEWSFEAVSFLSPDEFRARVEGAQIVITHAGAGAMATAIRAGKRPLVLARDAALAEHVDDHQTELTAKLEALGLVVRVDGPLDGPILEAASSISGRAADFSHLPSLAEEVERAINRPDVDGSAVEQPHSVA